MASEILVLCPRMLCSGRMHSRARRKRLTNDGRDDEGLVDEAMSLMKESVIRIRRRITPPRPGDHFPNLPRDRASIKFQKTPTWPIVRSFQAAAFLVSFTTATTLVTVNGTASHAIPPLLYINSGDGSIYAECWFEVALWAFTDHREPRVETTENLVWTGSTVLLQAETASGRAVGAVTYTKGQNGVQSGQHAPKDVIDDPGGHHTSRRPVDIANESSASNGHTDTTVQSRGDTDAPTESGGDADVPGSAHHVPDDPGGGSEGDTGDVEGCRESHGHGDDRGRGSSGDATNGASSESRRLAPKALSTKKSRQHPKRLKSLPHDLPEPPKPRPEEPPSIELEGEGRSLTSFKNELTGDDTDVRKWPKSSTQARRPGRRNDCTRRCPQRHGRRAGRASGGNERASLRYQARRPLGPRRRIGSRRGRLEAPKRRRWR
ncbi:hypothetical protein OG21DRAFT_1527971 [Imleria badia]|nr:hypothetical protein OG21DRAFT_1527971 [Imleria badia]